MSLNATVLIFGLAAVTESDVDGRAALLLGADKVTFSLANSKAGFSSISSRMANAFQV
jgi:hypothetical protein